MYVMKLIDVFEDAKSILIVSEYLAGGDLYDYLDRRNFIISEARLR
jgi:serine/threonine protein kinase